MTVCATYDKEMFTCNCTQMTTKVCNAEYGVMLQRVTECDVK